MKAVCSEETVAESDETVVVDGNHYFPPHSVDRRYLSESRMRSVCPWKGIARYYTIEANGERNHNAAWTYPRPLPWISRIRGHVAFPNGVEVRR